MITKNIITRKEAVKLAPIYVKFVEGGVSGLRHWPKVDKAFQKLKRGQTVLTRLDGVYMKCKVTYVSRRDFRAVDGPVVRVSNGEYTWRVDGCDWAWPLKGKEN